VPKRHPIHLDLSRRTISAGFQATIVVAGLPLHAHAQDPAASPSLIALSFNLSSVPGAAPSRKSAVAPAWRTTFGSERRSAPPRPKNAGLPGADIVLLQGISDMKSVRQWFPARDWKLVVSRQLLISDDPLETWSRDGIASVPTTGIAVRYRPGMRVTAQDHLLDLAKADDTQPNSIQPAGTAIRVQMAGTTIWALSVHLPPECLGASQACVANDTMARWWQSKKQPGLVLITGGRFGDPANPAPQPGPCAQQLLRVEPGDVALGVVLAHAKPDSEIGCAATAAIKN
jgi:hypothetical protein